MKGVEQETREDFKAVAQQVSVESVASYLLEKQGHLYRFPGERTASIRIYPATQSFYDFGRGRGGDVIRLSSQRIGELIPGRL